MALTEPSITGLEDVSTAVAEVPGVEGVAAEQHQKGCGYGTEGSVDAEHHAAPVEPVSHDASKEDQNGPGSVEEDCYQPHLERGSSQFQDEIAQHQQLHPPRDFMDRPGNPENAEVPDLQNSQGRDSGSP